MTPDELHRQRLDTARDAVEFICGRTDDEMATEVVNCPGWTVYNAAVHVGKVGIAWRSMIEATPDDAESRTRGYAEADSRGTGHSGATLQAWALEAIDALDTDVDRPAYFSMTGGHGTVGLWGWHAASEVGIHRLDVEDALGLPPAMTEHQALDALTYTCEFFLPAMARVTETEPSPVHVLPRLEADSTPILLRTSTDERHPEATLAGAPVDVLLALWGRRHGATTITGSADAVDGWKTLPSVAFQFGTWD